LRRYDLQSTIWTVAGFLLGAGLVIFAEFLLVAAFSAPGYYVTPRGLGWVTVPIAGGMAGAAFGARFRLKSLDDFLSKNRQVKLTMVGTLGWSIAYLGFVYLAQPFGTYWGSGQWEAFWRWFTIPPVLFAAVGGLSLWVLRDSRGATQTPAPPVSTDNLSKADKIRATLEPLIFSAKGLGATSPRMAFEMAIRRASTDEEWERHRQPWELLWPHVKSRR
jgi:hypothetical protein